MAPNAGNAEGGDVAGRRARSVAAWILLWQMVVVVVAVAASVLLIFHGSERDARGAALARTGAVAEVMSNSGRIADGLAGVDETTELRGYLARMAPLVRVDWITVYRLDGERLAANRTAVPAVSPEVVREFADNGEAASDFRAATGAAVRSVALVRGDDGVPVGVLEVAVDLDTIRAELDQRIAVLVWSGVAMLVVLGAGAAALSAYLRRITGGRGAEELSRMFQFYDAGLRAIGDGIILLDDDGRVALLNDAARRLLDLPSPDPGGEAVADEPPALPDSLSRLLAGRRVLAGEPLLTEDHVLLVDAEPVRSTHGTRRRIGTIVTLRDHTELQRLTGDVDTARTLADALGSQAHEFANRLHTIVALVELGRTDEAIDFASAEVESSQQLAEQIVGAAGDPFLTALLLGKSAQAHERGIRFEVTLTGQTDATAVPPRHLVTVLGNLIDNALDAAAQTDEPAVRVEVDAGPSALTLAVTDSGTGPDPARVDGIFELGATSKATGERRRGIGLALVRQSARRLGGRVEVSGATFRVTLPYTDAEREGSS
jgi:two-component system CitB family sensor kinase